MSEVYFEVISEDPPRVAVLLEGDLLNGILRVIGENSRSSLSRNGPVGELYLTDKEADALTNFFMRMPLSVANEYVKNHDK